MQLPFVAHLGWIFVFFLCATAVFHLLFVWPCNLSKLAWKWVDYVWLTATLLGLVGLVGSARQEFAKNSLDMTSARQERAAYDLKSAIQFGASPAICREFTYKDTSPPKEIFNQIQLEFRHECEWFKEAAERLEISPWTHREYINLAQLGKEMPNGGDMWAKENLQQSMDRYNTAVTDYKLLSEAKEKSMLEGLMVIAAPFLLALALALRFAKVTGEIRHELS